MGREKEQEATRPDGEQIEADRQHEVSIWARGFGVSSDDLSGALYDGKGGAQEEVQAEVEAERERDRK
ncbi:hypothetical protein [Pseudoxanthomonas suwonensis]|uniref:DUF3606 domain-containing protein n=1 Tax=Pseudoxanthomonas suwonensis TaxID=314722 RepID=A0A0E3Z2T4_9GAMM|nr:hypothetical protein [Pseudoxanthomonas suwonensis]AKC87939.1 hypothetical protein WQ53_15335 [Pseudoxanthomonas suwonensis]